MIIHLIASMRKLDEDLAVLKEISNILYANNHLLARSWFERLGARDINEDNLDWPNIVAQNIKDIRRSDAMIVEGSHFNYSQGFQTAIALQHNKPVLNLYKESAPELSWPDRRFVSGVSHPLFTSKSYRNENDLEAIVLNFLEDFEYTPEEITIKLGRQAKEYIDNIAKSTGKTKSEIIEQIIEKEARL